MKIRLQLFASLSRYLPGGGGGESQGVSFELPDGTTLGALVQRLGVPDEVPRISLVNGRDAEAEQVLKDGDVVSLFPPLAGGGSPGRDLGPPFPFVRMYNLPLKG